MREGRRTLLRRPTRDLSRRYGADQALIVIVPEAVTRRHPDESEL
jgi:hypothetical protein